MTVAGDLDRLISHDNIRQLAARYCWALDTLDRDMLAAVFTNEPTASLGRGLQTGFEEIWQVIHGVLSRLDVSQHLIGSHIIELADDANTATSRCYFQAQHVRAGTVGGDQFIVAGRYEDDVVRVNDVWRIRHRKLTVMWTSGNPAVIEP